jgi:hypothetical protein
MWHLLSVELARCCLQQSVGTTTFLAMEVVRLPILNPATKGRIDLSLVTRRPNRMRSHLGPMVAYRNQRQKLVGGERESRSLCPKARTAFQTGQAPTPVHSPLRKMEVTIPKPEGSGRFQGGARSIPRSSSI